MIKDLLQSISKVYIAYGATDFRKQIDSLCIEVKSKFHLNPYEKAAFIFCNKKRNSIKVLCYDKNGFILAQKKLLDTEKMKFQWPRNKDEVKEITKQQLEWLLDGLEIEQKHAHHSVDLSSENTCF